MANRIGLPAEDIGDSYKRLSSRSFFFFQAEDGIRDGTVTGVQTCALPISPLQRFPLQLQRWARGPEPCVTHVRLHRSLPCRGGSVDFEHLQPSRERIAIPG